MADPTSQLSVAIATLDRPERVARCLDALDASVEIPAEILVVDQSAGDETEYLVTRCRLGRSPVRYVRQPRLGLSASRNAALRLASSPVVAMTDDDCVPGDGWVACLRDSFTDPAVSAVSGRILPLGPEAPGLYPVSLRQSTEPACFHRKAPPWMAGSGGNFAVRRQVWARIGGFDERLGAGSAGRAAEDMDFIYRLLSDGEMIVYDPGAVVYHERQELGRRLASRWTYGFGIGATCGKWLRTGDLYALQLLLGWYAWRGREFLTAAWKRQPRARREARLMLLGTAAGFGYGLRLTGRV